MKPEAQIQKHIVELMRDKLGFNVWDTSQGYRKERGGTRTTAGMPDLLIAGHGYILWVEVKTENGKLTFAQEFFKSVVEANGGLSLVWRSDHDAWDWCVSEGIIEESPEAA